MILETVASVGFVLHLFILGVQIDPSLLKRAGRSTIITGVASFMVPFVICTGLIKILPNLVTLDDKMLEHLPIVVGVASITTLPVITSLLADLKILNSDVGRLASTAAMVTDLTSLAMSGLIAPAALSIHLLQWKPLLSSLLPFAFLLLILLVFRPLIVRFAKNTPEGHPMRENHIITILVMLLLCGFCSECLGQNAALGAFLLGIGVPDGPLLGASLVQKIDTLPTGILLPAKFAIAGMLVDTSIIGGGNLSSLLITELTILLAYLVKFIGTFGFAIYYSVPFLDAVYFSSIMCCKGIIDVNAYVFMLNNLAITDQEYSLLVINMLIITGIIRFLVGNLYDPSGRYLAYMKNSILHSQPDGSLRVLVCIHNEDNVSAIINLLQALNPTRIRPITVFTLNLMELTGRATAVLVPNFGRDKNIYCGLSSQIINVFTYFSHRNQGFITVQHFTAIAPYESMHDDICTIAVDKNAHIIIVPFHKQWAIDGRVGATLASIRMVNLNVMEKAPCSVGLLVDRGKMGGTHSVLTGSKSIFRISQLFIGGYDDREALACSSRMADHPNVSFTLVWLRPWNANKGVHKELPGCIDSEMIEKFRASAMGKEKLVYREEFVKDAVDTTRVLQSMESSCDLFIVGRDHDQAFSKVTLGLRDWIECPELGVIGDMVVSSDNQISVLVVQQQLPGFGFAKGSNARRPFSSSLALASKVYPTLPMEISDDRIPEIS